MSGNVYEVAVYSDITKGLGGSFTETTYACRVDKNVLSGYDASEVTIPKKGYKSIGFRLIIRE